MLTDTDPRAERVLIECLREMPIWRRMQRVGQLNEMVVQMALAGVRERHPEADEAEVFRRFADIRLGPELARRAYGPAPWEDDGENVAQP